MRLIKAFRSIAIASLLALTVSVQAQAQTGTPTQFVVAGCVGYASALADDISGSTRNTPAWDGVFRPAREECLRRNGSQNMPNGLMFAPFYSPGGNNSTPAPHVSYKLTSAEVLQGRVVLGTCRNYAFRQADPIAARGSTFWYNAFGNAIRQCLAHTGAKPDGSGLASPPLSQRTGGMAFAIAAAMGDDNQASCPTDACITVFGNPIPIPIDILRWIANTPLPGSNGNTPGSNNNGDTPGGPSDSGGVFPPFVEDWIRLCTAAPGMQIAECLKYKCVQSGRIAEQCDEMVERVLKELADLIAKAMLAAGGATSATWLERNWQATKDILKDTLENVKNDPKAKPALVLVGVALVTLLCIETGGACILIAPRLAPAAAGVLGMVSSSGGSNARAVTAEQAVTAYCRSVVTRAARNAGWTPAPVAVDGFTQVCAMSVPGRADRQALATAIVADCDRAGANAVRNAGASTAPETAYSRGANQCLRLRAVEAMNFGQVPELGTQFANRLTDELQSCAERAGLQWQGSDTTGAVVVPPGVRNGLAQMANCLKAWPATVP